ncbi:MAG: hypothetical protein OEM38_05495 [Gammaproteobacteria bacterium]|nr:hypothetical protein [Gammaproteobacteria bacterium]
MIIELYKYVTNPASQSAKKLGQLREIIGMEARYKRSRKQWDSHLQNTKSLIEEASLKILNPDEVIILGSGLLLDIPIDFLSRHFNRVILVDVVHLKQVKKHTKKYDNIEFVEHDVTGLSSQLVGPYQKQLKLQARASIPNINDKTSLVVSANLLSQLHLIPVEYAKKELGLNSTEQELLATEITSCHIKLLENLSSQVCLISDYQRFYKDKNNNILDIENVLFDSELPKPYKTWRWEIAPIGEISNQYSMSSKVYAYPDFNNKVLYRPLII